MTMQLFSGKQYLKIDAANHFGLDKLDWDQRLAWFDEQEDNLENLVRAADAPALFYASVEAYRQAQHGLPSGYPISLDATASGLQILAVLTGCELSALLCNVVDTGHREDAYTRIYQIMLNELGEGTRIGREDVKYAIMTALYGSTEVPKKTFKEGDQLKVFYETMNAYAPGAWKCNEAFRSFWDPTAYSNDWILPDNYHVHIKVMARIEEQVTFLDRPYDVIHMENQPVEESRSLGANTTHSVDGMVVREMSRRCTFKPEMIYSLVEAINSTSMSVNRPKDSMVMNLWNHYEKCGFLSARILGYLDQKNMGLVDAEKILQMISTMPKKPFDVLSIHDCFRCLPNYGNDLRKQYNQILSEIAGSTVLSYIVRQITGKPIVVNKMGDLSSKVLEANYALS